LRDATVADSLIGEDKTKVREAAMSECTACHDVGWLEVSVDGIEAPEDLVFVQRCRACNLYATDMAAAEARADELDAEVLAVVCRQPQFVNYYQCPDDGKKWVMTWSCMCNDRCPRCNHEIEPYKSE
jgi:hypothetical protein